MRDSPEKEVPIGIEECPEFSSEQREDWQYPQRIDVHEWEDKCAGVQVDGLAEAVAFPLYRLAVFEIPKSFFEIIRARLQL